MTEKRKVMCKKSEYHGFHPEDEDCGYCEPPVKFEPKPEERPTQPDPYYSWYSRHVNFGLPGGLKRETLSEHIERSLGEQRAALGEEGFLRQAEKNAEPVSIGYELPAGGTWANATGEEVLADLRAALRERMDRFYGEWFPDLPDVERLFGVQQRALDEYYRIQDATHRVRTEMAAVLGIPYSVLYWSEDVLYY